MIIKINTHDCTKEELKALLKYLEEQCWDYRKENKNKK